ncbi:hypothetical protein CDAR_245881 [Caerostris darwini]|uniref:Uncharacterized protein n=1 Tax=Caerostris darwini TaxID=1538125 RepID=A0AAV4VHA9_9ARAC|nr:hypothetical protein CDAR_245881 [Caerostris darwini]
MKPALKSRFRNFDQTISGTMHCVFVYSYLVQQSNGMTLLSPDLTGHPIIRTEEQVSTSFVISKGAPSRHKPKAPIHQPLQFRNVILIVAYC